MAAIAHEQDITDTNAPSLDSLGDHRAPPPSSQSISATNGATTQPDFLLPPPTPHPITAVATEIPRAPDGNSGIPRWNGLFTPVIPRAAAFVGPLLLHYLGNDSATSLKTFITNSLFLLDNLNMIAYLKLMTWTFHPGRHPHWGKTRHLHFVWIRFMFLVTNLVTVAVQYSIFYLISADQVRKDGLMYKILSNNIADGAKYAGFTNHLVQTFLLYRPGSPFGRRVVNESRTYMEEIQFIFCVCAPVIAISIEGRHHWKLISVVYAIMLLLDFTLKRIVLDSNQSASIQGNWVRRRISSLASEVRSKTYSTAASTGATVPKSSVAMGFAFEESQTGKLSMFALFFVLNAVLQKWVYGPINARVLKMIHA